MGYPRPYTRSITGPLQSTDGAALKKGVGKKLWNDQLEGKRGHIHGVVTRFNPSSLYHQEREGESKSADRGHGTVRCQMYSSSDTHVFKILNDWLGAYVNCMDTVDRNNPQSHGEAWQVLLDGGEMHTVVVQNHFLEHGAAGTARLAERLLGSAQRLLFASGASLC